MSLNEFWTSQKNTECQEAMLVFVLYALGINGFRNCVLLCYNLNGPLCFYVGINII